MTRQTTLLAALAAVLVIALWWLFLYSPGQDELARIEDEIAVAENEQVSLEQRVARLEMVRARAPETEAAIARLASFVPDDPALPAALRQIQASADDAGARIVAIATARPTIVDEGTGLHTAQLTLTVEGSYFQLVDLMRRIEDPEITARGITFNNVTLTATEYPTLTASIGGEMYSVLDPVPDPATADEPADADPDAAVDDDEGAGSPDDATALDAGGS